MSQQSRGLSACLRRWIPQLPSLPEGTCWPYWSCSSFLGEFFQHGHIHYKSSPLLTALGCSHYSMEALYFLKKLLMLHMYLAVWSNVSLFGCSRRVAKPSLAPLKINVEEFALQLNGSRVFHYHILGSLVHTETVHSYSTNFSLSLYHHQKLGWNPIPTRNFPVDGARMASSSFCRLCDKRSGYLVPCRKAPSMLLYKRWARLLAPVFIAIVVWSYSREVVSSIPATYAWLMHFILHLFNISSFNCN